MFVALGYNEEAKQPENPDQRRQPMTVKAGNEAEHTGDLRCKKCGELVHVEEGVSVPRCPICNSEDFTIRNRPEPKGAS